MGRSAEAFRRRLAQHQQAREKRDWFAPEKRLSTSTFVNQGSRDLGQTNYTTSTEKTNGLLATASSHKAQYRIPGARPRATCS